jgi:hypothetical protein
VNHGVRIKMKSLKSKIALELSKRIEMPVSETDFDILQPVIKMPDGSDRNSRVFLQFVPSFPHLTKSVSMDYDRIHVSDLGVIKTAKLTAVNVHDVLEQINTDYKLDLKPDDVVNEPLGLPDGVGLVTVNFEFTPECLNFYSGVKIETISSLAVGEQNKSEVVYATIDTLRSSGAAVISNLSYDVATRQNSVARANMPATEGSYQYEVTILSGGLLIGFVTSGAAVDMPENKRPGHDKQGWMFDTSTGEFYTNGVTSPLARSFRFGETVAVIVNKQTGVVTIMDEQNNEYSTAPTDISLVSAVYPAFASSTQFVSRMHINFGQEPFLISTDDTVKKGYYTTK